MSYASQNSLTCLSVSIAGSFLNIGQTLAVNISPMEFDGSHDIRRMGMVALFTLESGARLLPLATSSRVAWLTSLLIAALV